MRNHVLITISVALAASGAPRDAWAQWGYGWGGWGGSTAQGDIARGLGAFNVGVGQANLADAQARSINTDTVIRWNQAVWESQHALNVSNYLRRKQRQATVDQARSEIYDRLRNHPETHDIQDGDALNVLLDILQHPNVFRTAYRQTRTPLSREVIQDIPFEFASEGMTICLDQITTKDGWPLALRDDDSSRIAKRFKRRSRPPWKKTNGAICIPGRFRRSATQSPRFGATSKKPSPPPAPTTSRPATTSKRWPA